MVRDFGAGESVGLEDGAIFEAVPERESRVFSSATTTCSLCLLDTHDDNVPSKSNDDFELLHLESGPIVAFTKEGSLSRCWTAVSVSSISLPVSKWVIESIGGWDVRI